MPSLWVTTAEGTLVPLEAEGYANEKDFQKLLAENPAVLAAALDGEEAGGWLLVDRELPIKAEESEFGTWSVDHLFVGADGTPILVEVKRSSDPRARREVVAQMLDYAASFALDWSAERLRDRWERRSSLSGAVAGQAEMDTFLAAASLDEPEQLWAQAQTRIDAGQIRLVFVADRLSPTLVRIIEYLNGQLRSAEVLGVEVLRHASSGATGPVVYQPVVRGRSTPAAQRKGPAPRRTREEFDQVVAARHGQQVLDAISALVAAAKDMGGFESLGTSAENPALYINFHTKGGAPFYWPFLFRPKQGKLIVRIQKLRTQPAFADETVRDDLLGRVAAAVGEANTSGNPDGAPWVPLATLTRPGALENLTAVLKWVTETADANA